MPLAEIRLQSQGLQGFRMRLLFPLLCWLIEMVNSADRDREPGMCKRELRIERNRLFIQLRGSAEILQEIIRSRLIIATFEVKNVSVCVVRRFRFHSRFFLRRKRSPERVRNGLRHFRFHAEDVD